MQFVQWTLKQNTPYYHNRQKLFLDSLWYFIKTKGFGDKFLWITEQGTGWTTIPEGDRRQGELQLATYLTHISNEQPAGPVNGSFLWAFTTLFYPDCFEGWRGAITDDGFYGRAGGFTYRQMTNFLKASRYNRSLAIGNTYDSIRVYEFENPQTGKRTYVGWKERFIGGDSIKYNFPLRTNRGRYEVIRYQHQTQGYIVDCDSRGYLPIYLDTVPKYVYELNQDVYDKSDLIIDSIWTDPFFPCDSDSVVTYARIKNIGTDTTLDSIFVRFAVNGDTISTELIDSDIPPDSTATLYAGSKWLSVHGPYLVRTDVNACKKFVELDFNNNTKYKHYTVPIRPYGTIKINRDSSYTNIPYVILCLNGVDPNDSINPSVDSMRIWQTFTRNDTLYEFALPMMKYDTICFWYLREGEKTNKVYVKYKVNPGYESRPIFDQIIFDKTAPESSFVVNDNDRFTDSTWIAVNNDLVDTLSGLSRMRYGHNYLKNIVINSSFQDTVYWKAEVAVFIDSLKLFKIPILDTGNYFYQAIPPDSLAGFDNDTMLLAIDLVSDSFKGAGKIQFQYIYGTDPDSCPPRGGQQPYPYGTSITIPQGTKANVSQYNHYSYFKYHPNPPPGQNFLEARIGVFVDSNASNSG